MRRMIFGLAAMAALLLGSWVQAAQTSKSVDLRDLMSVTQFHQSGLDKLTPQELAALNSWLNDYLHQDNPSAAGHVPPAASAPAASVPATAAAFGSEQIPEKGAQQIESRIDGVLKGWTGNTVFKLENGQVWQQAGPGYENDIRLDHPQVVIKKLAFGYLLTLPGHNENVFVRRVK
ncbi:MAG: hypothetical protein ACRETO_01060 [Gammaproteobacteria bacterium]